MSPIGAIVIQLALEAYSHPGESTTVSGPGAIGRDHDRSCMHAVGTAAANGYDRLCVRAVGTAAASIYTQMH